MTESKTVDNPDCQGDRDHHKGPHYRPLSIFACWVFNYSLNRNVQVIFSFFIVLQDTGRISLISIDVQIIYTSIHLCMYVRMYVRVCMHVCMYLHLLIYPFAYQWISLSICLWLISSSYIYLPVHLSIHPPYHWICLSDFDSFINLYLSIYYLPINGSIHLSMHMSI